MSFNVLISGIGAFAALVAAVFWIWSSRVHIPDNIDTFIPALQRASQLSSVAAIAAAVAAICGAILFARGVW